MDSKLLVILLFALVYNSYLFAQENADSIPPARQATDTLANVRQKTKQPLLDPYHKNVIKFNPTPMLLFGEIRNITISYERLIAKNQSVAVQAGYLLFPRLFDDTIVSLLSLTDRSKYGVNLSFDYRFYPGARNRRPAPDGLYIGGYLSYYGFRFYNHFDILYTEVDKNGTMEGKFNFFNLGIQLGYQFVFWKRFTIDLLMFGPSLSYYHREMELSGDLDETEIENIDEEVIQKILDRFPALKTIFGDDDLRISGSSAKLSFGFRYSIQLGFHF
jgi:hypothetical protein